MRARTIAFGLLLLLGCAPEDRSNLKRQAIQPAPGSTSAPDGYFVTWPWP